MTKLVKVDFDKLTSAQIDWVVGKIALRPFWGEDFDRNFIISGGMAGWRDNRQSFGVRQYSPTLNWLECGPLMEKYEVIPEKDVEGYSEPDEPWYACCKHSNMWVTGKDLKFAVCKAIIAKEIIGPSLDPIGSYVIEVPPDV